MATFVTTAAKTYLGEYAVDTDLTAIGLNYGAEMVDDTVLGDTTRSRAGGLKTAQAELTGFLNHSNSEVATFANVGVQNVPLTIAPITGAEDERAFAMLCTVGSISLNHTLGEMAAISISGEASGGDSGIVRGQIAINATSAASDTTTGSQIGAVTATQKMYAALHVIGASGTTPTLDLVVQSDDNSGFTSASNRITFSQVTDTATSEWSSVSGVVDDDWWRIDYIITGTDPSYTFVVFLGIA